MHVTAAQTQAWFLLGHTADCCAHLGGGSLNHLTVDVKLYGRRKRVYEAPRTNIWYNQAEKKWENFGVRRPTRSVVEGSTAREGKVWAARSQMEKWSALASLSLLAPFHCTCNDDISVAKHKLNGLPSRIFTLNPKLYGLAHRKSKYINQVKARFIEHLLSSGLDLDGIKLSKIIGGRI